MEEKNISFDELKKKNAVKWNKDKMHEIVNFFEKMYHFPIVSINVQRHLEEVLKPAFIQLEALDRLPDPQRWINISDLSRSIGRKSEFILYQSAVLFGFRLVKLDNQTKLEHEVHICAALFM